MNKGPIILAILDGFGLAKNSKSNAITQANMEYVEKLKKYYPFVDAYASGKWVGLPDGQMGNSEVGHLHIGSGRIKYQSLSLINNAIKDNTFFQNKEIKIAINHAKKYNSNLHILGMLSDGGVHSHMNHMFAIIKYCKQENFNKLYLHIICDGRDTKPSVVKKYIKALNETIAKFRVGIIASISGRYYTMDRDRRFDRCELAYDAIVLRKGNSCKNVLDYVDFQYNQNITDEFIKPAFVKEIKNAKIKANDSFIFTNFRPDRAIQIASAITDSKYGWNKNSINNLYFVSMMKYADSVKSNKYAFIQEPIVNGLGEVLANNNIKQLRIAETEKIAHVTYFFDGGKDVEYKNSTRILIPSPKVATYDLKPEMSAKLITSALIKELEKNKFKVIILNFANADMVGHTGILKATIKAMKVLDQCLLKIHKKLLEFDGTLIITGDHGNAEVMLDESMQPNKKHTSNKVPIIITDKSLKLRSKNISITNISPTILDLLNIKIPKEMTEKSLIILNK